MSVGWAFLIANRAPDTAKFPLETRGKSAVYVLCWVSTRGTILRGPGP